MQLSQELNKQIIDFLLALPNMADKAMRQALLVSAGVDAQCKALCNVDLAPAQYFPDMVEKLGQYGRLQDSREAIEAILEDARNYVGLGGKEIGNRLIRACWQSHKPFVTGYQTDIFVSYASADDRLTAETGAGWVMTFARDLRKLLTQKLGYEKTYAFSMGSELEYFPLTAPRLASFRRTAVFIIILSQEYLASPWCQDDAHGFLQILQKLTRAGSQVFVVERESCVDPKPATFADVPAYQFWESDGGTGDYKYHNTLTRLNEAIVKELQRLRRGVEQPYRTPKISVDASAHSPTVFVAEVTDDLEESREELLAFLQQKNVCVLPESYYPRDPQTFQLAVQQDVTQTDLFVQLLSRFPGKRPATLPQGYIRYQTECAEALHKPVLQWRSPDLNLAMISDPEWRTFLQRATVHAMDMSAFQAEILRRLAEQKTIDRSLKHTDLMVLIHNDPLDAPLAEEIRDIFDTFGVGWMLLPEDERPIVVREAFERYVQDCDALMIVYGQVAFKWVGDQLLAVRKIAWK